jgi:hypothetical protein
MPGGALVAYVGILVAVEYPILANLNAHAPLRVPERHRACGNDEQNVSDEAQHTGFVFLNGTCLRADTKLGPCSGVHMVSTQEYPASTLVPRPDYQARLRW